MRPPLLSALPVRVTFSFRRIRPAWGPRVVIPLVLAVLLSACIEHPFKPRNGASPEATPQARIAEVARATARALSVPEARASVLGSMRASPRVNHSLILQNYLADATAGVLLDRSAAAMGIAASEYRELVSSLPELEFLVALDIHRTSWRGADGVAVAAQWG